MPLSAAQADAIYGDSFTRDGDAIRCIGNNVSLVFERMDFGESRSVWLTLSGSTPLEQNPITIRIQSENGEESTQIAEFTGSGGEQQRFALIVPGGACTVTFVFLPGSQFDFELLLFMRR